MLRLYVFSLLASLLVSTAHVSPALAESLQLGDTVPKEQQAILKRKRARIGVGFSAVSLFAGGVMVGVGAAVHGDLNVSGDVDKGTNAIPVIVVGAVLSAGGVAGLPPSMVRLRCAKREIDGLDIRAPRTTVHLGGTTLALTHRF